MQKNKNVTNVKECVKKLNIYMKNSKVTSNRHINKETNKQNNIYIYIYKNSKVCMKIYKIMYIQTLKYTNIQKCTWKNISVKI